MIERSKIQTFRELTYVLNCIQRDVDAWIPVRPQLTAEFAESAAILYARIVAQRSTLLSVGHTDEIELFEKAQTVRDLHVLLLAELLHELAVVGEHHDPTVAVTVGDVDQSCLGRHLHVGWLTEVSGILSGHEPFAEHQSRPVELLSVVPEHLV